MSDTGLSRLPRALRLGVIGIAAFIVWTAIKWVVRIYIVVWLEQFGVPRWAGLLIAFGLVAAIVAAAAYFLKPWFDRLMKDGGTKDI